MTEPTEAIMARLWAFVNTAERPYQTLSISPDLQNDLARLLHATKKALAAMPPFDPDTHRASSDEVERIMAAIDDTIDLSGELVDDLRASGNLRKTATAIAAALAAMSVQSDKGEG